MEKITLRFNIINHSLCLCVCLFGAEICVNADCKTKGKIAPHHEILIQQVYNFCVADQIMYGILDEFLTSIHVINKFLWHVRDKGICTFISFSLKLSNPSRSILLRRKRRKWCRNAKNKTFHLSWSDYTQNSQQRILFLLLVLVVMVVMVLLLRCLKNTHRANSLKAHT